MSSKPIVLFQATEAPTSDGSVYTQGNGAGTLVIVDKFSGCNQSASAATVTISIVPSGGDAGTGNIIVKTRPILAGETYGFPEIVGQKLAPGDFISVTASVAGVNLRGSGTLVGV